MFVLLPVGLMAVLPMNLQRVGGSPSSSVCLLLTQRSDDSLVLLGLRRFEENGSCMLHRDLRLLNSAHPPPLPWTLTHPSYLHKDSLLL